MAQLIKASDVKVITKDGECKLSINIDLNINLNTLGVSVSAQPSNKLESQDFKKEDTAWEIPDFTPQPKVNFGKKA